MNTQAPTARASAQGQAKALLSGAGQEVIERHAEAAELQSLHLCAGETHHLGPFCGFDGD